MIIKPINTPLQIKQVAQVEAETWGLNPSDTVPDHVLTAIANDGGVLLGAYDRDQLIGFTLGWLGTTSQEDGIIAADYLKLVSHMTGVLDGYRDQRIGYHLKLAQREWALARGLDLVTWTYDPLESRNAYLNIHLLGCTCQTYYRDYYGEMSDQMNEGIASDRLRVDWWINSDRVRRCLSPSPDQKIQAGSIELYIQVGVQLLNPTKLEGGYHLPGDQTISPSKTRLLVEIPADIQAIRQKDREMGVAWRRHTREIFESVFSAGYRVVDFIYIRGETPQSYYLLRNDADED